jgi:protein TonB
VTGFVWAKFMLLSQLDILTVVAWSVTGLFVIAAALSYFGRLVTPMQTTGEGVLTWVPIPEDLPQGDVGPYGAFVLKSSYKNFMTRGVVTAIIVHSTLIGTGLLVAKILTREPEVVQARVVSYAELGAPPSLSQKEAPATGVNVGPPPPPPPSAAIPIPVPDATAPKTTTILSQKELGDLGPMFEGGSGEGSIWGGSGGGGFGGGGVTVGEVNDNLDPNAFQPVEQLPELITIPEPNYPTLAREAGVEGVVRLLVLVGKDGKVKNVKVEQSIQALDGAAKEAAMQAVFKPALWQKKPVAVWVSVPIRFNLRDA